MNNRFRAFAIAGGIFFLGAIIGAGLSYQGLKHYEDALRISYNIPPPPPKSQFRRIFHRLHLTPEQAKRFNEILAEAGPRFGELETMKQKQGIETNQKIDVIWDETNLKLRAILNDEQKVIFDNFLDKFNQWRQQRSESIRSFPSIKTSYLKKLPLFCNS